MLCDLSEKEAFQTIYCPTAEMTADILLAKPLVMESQNGTWGFLQASLRRSIGEQYSFSCCSFNRRYQWKYIVSFLFRGAICDTKELQFFLTSVFLRLLFLSFCLLVSYLSLNSLPPKVNRYVENACSIIKRDAPLFYREISRSTKKGHEMGLIFAHFSMQPK